LVVVSHYQRVLDLKFSHQTKNEALLKVTLGSRVLCKR